MKKLTAIVLAMLMVMSMGVFSSSAVCYDTDGETVIDCVDAETPADDVCGETIEDDSSDPLDFFSNIIATLQGYVEKIVEFFQDFIDTIRGFGDA